LDLFTLRHSVCYFFCSESLAIDPVDGTLNYVIALLLSPIRESEKEREREREREREKERERERERKRERERERERKRERENLHSRA
jgi:hypothetical protein